jgi:DNA-directed RNA polymerase beta' subunit
MSRWTQIRGDAKERPRKLTDQEIADLVSVITPVKSPDETASMVATEQIKKLLTSQLKSIELCPVAIETLKRHIEERYRIATVVPGEAVGVTVAEAIAAISTQMTLKTTHKSGSSESASAGIEPLLELLYIRNNRRFPITTVFFKNKHMSLEETLNKRIQLVKITIDDIKKNYEIIDFNDLNRDYWWYQGVFEGDAKGDAKEVGYFSVFGDKQLKKTDKVLRLYFDVDEMYRMRIAMKDIVETFDRYDATNIICVHGPLHTGIMDIYYNKETIETYLSNKGLTNIKSESSTIFYNIVISELKNMKIKGIDNIKGIITYEAPVWQIVSREDQKSDNQYYLLLRETRTKYIGITRQSLINLLNKIGINTITQDKFGITVSTPKGTTKSPKEILDAKMDGDIKMMKEQKVKTSELDRAAKVRYVKTIGSNLQQILNMNDVDGSITISNNFHEVTRTLGVEAAYVALCNELDQVIRNVGSYVNPRHIALTYSFICSRGYPFGANYSGASKLRVGTFSLASLEHTPEVLIKDASFGRSEALNAASAIGLGAKIPFGTGTVSHEVDQNLKDEYEREMNIRRDEKSLTVSSEDIDNIQFRMLSDVQSSGGGVSDDGGKGLTDQSTMLQGESTNEDDLLIQAAKSSEAREIFGGSLQSSINGGVPFGAESVKVDLKQPPKPVVSGTPAVTAISQASIVSIEPIPSVNIDLSQTLTEYTPDVSALIADDISELNKL